MNDNTKMKRYRPIRFLCDRKTASVPVRWIIENERGYQCFWPMFGLNKKLKNCVPPPYEVDTEKYREWHLFDCVPISRKEYNSYEDADAAINLASDFDCGSVNGESTRIGVPSVQSVGSTTDHFEDRLAASSIKLTDFLVEQRTTEVLCPLPKIDECAGSKLGAAALIIGIDSPFPSTTGAAALTIGIASPLPENGECLGNTTAHFDEEFADSRIKSPDFSLEQRTNEVLCPLPKTGEYVVRTLDAAAETSTTADHFEDGLAASSIKFPDFSVEQRTTEMFCPMPKIDECAGSTLGAAALTIGIASPLPSTTADHLEVGLATMDVPNLSTEQHTTEVLCPLPKTGECTGNSLRAAALPIGIASPLPENDKCLGRTTDRKNPVAYLKWPLILKINKDEEYDDLSLVLKSRQVYDNLLQTYRHNFADNADTFVEMALKMTFKDHMILKLSFRNYKDKINIDDTLLLQCLKEAVGSNFEMVDEDARQAIFDTCHRLRNKEAQRNATLKRKHEANNKKKNVL